MITQKTYNFRRLFVYRALLLCGSIAVYVIIVEMVLRTWMTNGEIHNNTLKSLSPYAQDTWLILPKHLEMKPVVISGAKKAYMWQNKLHVFNEIGIRRSTPIPPKKKDVFRIAIFGDSMTYGMGVDSLDTYPSILEKLLAPTHKVEVLNLGVSGYQSEDVLNFMKREITQIQPDLIIYGVCLNDYLPSKTDYFDNDLAYKIPIPESWKKFITEHFVVGKLLQSAYNSVLMKIQLRNDYYTSVIKNMYSYQSRFKENVTQMNLVVTGYGLPTMVSMIINQYPSTEGTASKVSVLTEKIVQEAGNTVIPTWKYYEKYNNQQLSVNIWESHPNEQAHAIFAEHIFQYLSKMPLLERYKRI